MSTTELVADFRGAFRGLVGLGSQVVFCVEHPEGHPTGLYTFDAMKSVLSALALQGHGESLLVDGTTLWLALREDHVEKETDNTASWLYRSTASGLEKVGSERSGPAIALTRTDDGIAYLVDDHLEFLNEEGAVLGRFSLGATGSSVAASPDGEWVVAGTTGGTVALFQKVDGAFTAPRIERLHDGAVTDLAFAPNELRFYSAGADGRLLYSYARGALETEDRGGKHGHDRAITALLVANHLPTPRLFSLSLDGSIKAWPLSSSGSQRPSTFSSGVVQGDYLGLIELPQHKYQLVMGGRNGTLRFFRLDEEGKPEEHVLTLHNGYAEAQNFLTSSTPEHRENGVARLRSYDDHRALELLYQHIQDETDNRIRLAALQGIKDSSHPRSGSFLERLLSHRSSQVQLLSLEGLLARTTEEDLAPLSLALESNQEAIGLKALEILVERNTEATLALVYETLNHSLPALRFAALRALEELYPGSPRGILAGLKCNNTDVPLRALSRLVQANWVNHPEVQAPLRRTLEFWDEEVRRRASFVILYQRPKLVAALRYLSPDLHRSLVDLEEEGLVKTGERGSLPEAPEVDKSRLTEEDRRPLFQILSSRKNELAASAGTYLALLEDPRALGPLLILLACGDLSAELEACRALGILKDPRASQHLFALLGSFHDTMRNEALTSLLKIWEDEPLKVLEVALRCKESDIRQRALKELVEECRKATAPWQEPLLLGALNDSEKAIRQEAFKAILHLEIQGSPKATLEFLLQSYQSDIRTEALEEITAHLSERPYRELLLTLLADEDEKINSEAFSRARKNFPSEEQAEFYQRALHSPRKEVRIKAVRKLVKEKEQSLRDLLVEALHDESPTVRVESVNALVQMERVDLLKRALSSPHQDVRAASAGALAVLGVPEAYEPLIAVVEDWFAATKKEREELRAQTIAAIKGLAQLQDERALAPMLKLIEGDDDSLASTAAEALPDVISAKNLPLVRPLLRHRNEAVKIQAALALALYGDTAGVPLLKASYEREILISAGFLLAKEMPDFLSSFLEQNDDTSRLAMLLLFFQQFYETQEYPQTLIGLLQAPEAKYRFGAAQLLERYYEGPSFRAQLVEEINKLHYGDKINAETLEELARALSHENPKIRFVALRLFLNLFMPRYQSSFPKAWGYFQERCKERWSLPSLPDQPAPPSEATGEFIDDLVYGAYVALARDPHWNASDILPQALSNLEQILKRRPELLETTLPVFLGSFSDRYDDVRSRAFDILERLEVPKETIIAEALSVSSKDTATRGLRLLATQERGEERIKERLISPYLDHYFEAFQILEEHLGSVEASICALASPERNLRFVAIERLISEMSKSEKAARALRETLESPFDWMRLKVARELATQGDSSGLGVLLESLNSPDEYEQRQTISALANLEEPRIGEALIARIDDDPEKTANTTAIFEALEKWDTPLLRQKLLNWIEKDHCREEAGESALVISGYETYLWVDDREVMPFDSDGKPWKRDPDYFRTLLEVAYRASAKSVLEQLLSRVQWLPTSPELDETLAPLVRFSDNSIRHRAVEAVGWRHLHRDGPGQILEELLTSGDVVDQFQAAESLALAGNRRGLPVLRTALVALESYPLRERAVLAIGHLGDPSTLDSLLEMALDEEHELQAPAAEAIGHMSQSSRAEEIFTILKDYAELEDYSLSTAALRGLRWFGTLGAFHEILQIALSDRIYWLVEEALRLLRYHKESAPFLKDFLRQTDDYSSAEMALESLLHICEPESLEPYFAALQCSLWLDKTNLARQKVVAEATVEELFEFLPKIHENRAASVVPSISTRILATRPLPLEKALTHLDSKNRYLGVLAARILGASASEELPEPDFQNQINSALPLAAARALEETKKTGKIYARNRREKDLKHLEDQSEQLQWLLWACGRHGLGEEPLLEACDLELPISTRQIRENAVAALGHPRFSGGAPKLRALSRAPEPWLRSQAISALRAIEASAALSELPDEGADSAHFSRVIRGLTPEERRPALLPLIEGKQSGQVLNLLAVSGDLKGLLATLQDRGSSEGTRQAVIDAIGALQDASHLEPARDAMATFGASEENDETLRKAAWRARRRLQRRIEKGRERLV